MDPTIGWYQPEQCGPAKDLWQYIWEAEKGIDILNIKNDNSPVINGLNTMTSKFNSDYIPIDSSNNRVSDDRNIITRHVHNTCNNYYNPSRRKSDNRASTQGMSFNHDALIGAYGGCPWRDNIKQYSKGVVGYVWPFFFII